MLDYHKLFATHLLSYSFINICVTYVPSRVNHASEKTLNFNYSIWLFTEFDNPCDTKRGMCQFGCDYNSDGNLTCLCQAGTRLAADGKTCLGKV